MAKSIVGVDIGRDVIRAIEVENADKAKPNVLRFHEISVPGGALRSGEVREVNTVSAALKRLWSEGGFKSKDVVLGIGNQRVLARDFAVPRSSIEQIRESLPFQVQDMLPVPVADALLDFYPISEVQAEAGPVVNGLLIAAVKNSVLANVNAARGAGLSPLNVDLIPFALTRVLTRQGNSTGTVVLIDVGASTTNVVMVSNGVPQFLRMIPAGGADITTALMKKQGFSPAQAEAAKRARGLSPAPVSSDEERQTAEVIYQVVSELFNSLRNTITYYINSRPGEVIQQIVLAGGGSLLPGFGYALGEMMRTTVVPADPLSSVTFAGQARKGVGGDQAASMTIALGLALGGAA